MGQIIVKNGKSLKLRNVISMKNTGSDINGIGKSQAMLENYIKVNGGKIIGPSIQQVCARGLSSGEFDVEVIIYRQVDKPFRMKNNDFNYEMEVIINDCLYARYKGPENKLQYGYQKLMIMAFEEEIEIREGNYTVFLDKKENEVTVDIFIQKK